MKNVVIVGCGNMGSWHLVSLLGLGEECRFQVVEPDGRSVEVARKRVRQAVEAGAREAQIEWLDDLGRVSGGADLAIIATLATGRVRVMEELMSRGQRVFLVEKVVCQSEEEYARLVEWMRERGVRGWVNCTRRYCEFYQSVAEMLSDSDGPVVMNVKAGAIGLGCNAIHMIDLFGWLCGNGGEVRLGGEYVRGELLQNSRGRELCEFAGTLVGGTDRGDMLTVSFVPDGDGEVSVGIANKDVRAAVNEISGRGVVATRQGGWGYVERGFRIPYSSELTRVIAGEIFSTGSCRLPRVEELFAAHRELFSVFGGVMAGVLGERAELCPIT